jgi:hypothetical protein
MVLDILTILFLVCGWALIVIMVSERRRDVLLGRSMKRRKNNQTNAPASHQAMAVRRSASNASDEYEHLLEGIRSEIEKTEADVYHAIPGARCGDRERQRWMMQRKLPARTVHHRLPRDGLIGS